MYMIGHETFGQDSYPKAPGLWRHGLKLHLPILVVAENGYRANPTLGQMVGIVGSNSTGHASHAQCVGYISQPVNRKQVMSSGNYCEIPVWRAICILWVFGLDVQAPFSYIQPAQERVLIG